MSSITLWEAIRQMREISRQKGSFSITFMSYSRQRRTSDGIIQVPEARLRPADNPPQQFTDHMLNGYDIHTNEPFHFWQPLLMFFNNQKIQL